MGSFKYLNKFYHNNLVEKAIELGYREDNLLILKGDKKSLLEKWPQTYNNLKTCSHHKDERSFLEYGQDLVASWVFEDDFLKMMKEQGLIIKSSGSDKERVILSNKNVSSSSDFHVLLDGNIVSLELMSDYTGYWSKEGQVDLRDSKFNKMKKEKSLFVGLSLTDDLFIIKDFSKDIEFTYIRNHRPYGFKPAYRFSIDKSNLIPFTFKKLSEMIKKYINER